MVALEKKKKRNQEHNKKIIPTTDILTRGWLCGLQKATAVHQPTPKSDKVVQVKAE